MAFSALAGLFLGWQVKTPNLNTPAHPSSPVFWAGVGLKLVGLSHLADIAGVVSKAPITSVPV